MSLLSMAGATNIEGNTAFAFWRILTTSEPIPQSGSKRYAIAELQFNGVQAVGGIPLASSLHEASPNKYKLSYAFDGDVSGIYSWASRGGYLPGNIVGEWIGYHFPEKISVHTVTITSVLYNYEVLGRWAPRSFIVQYSNDGIEWIDSWEVISDIDFGNNETRTYHKPI